MMAYNRVNKLKFIQDIIQVYKAEKKEGMSVRHVYKTHIYPRFNISRSTLYNYLLTPVEKQLREEQARIREKQINDDTVQRSEKDPG